MQQVTELFRYHFHCRIVALLETKLCGFQLVPKPIKHKPKDKYYIGNVTKVTTNPRSSIGRTS